jgi:hypothetical protein
VEVRMTVIVEVHRDRDPVEAADRRHRRRSCRPGRSSHRQPGGASDPRCVATPVATSTASSPSTRSTEPRKSGRIRCRRTRLHGPFKVEGLVDCMVRGGSSPLGRIGKAPLSGALTFGEPSLATGRTRARGRYRLLGTHAHRVGRRTPQDALSAVRLSALRGRHSAAAVLQELGSSNGRRGAVFAADVSSRTFPRKRNPPVAQIPRQDGLDQPRTGDTARSPRKLAARPGWGMIAFGEPFPADGAGPG